MNIEIVRVSRRFRWPIWAAVLVSIWVGLGAIKVCLDRLALSAQGPFELCLFKRLTGLACPTCGFGRGALCFLHGHILQGWLFNPFLFSILGLFFAATMVQFVSYRAIRIHLSRNERAIAWIAIAALFSINWAYVILYVR